MSGENNFKDTVNSQMCIRDRFTAIYNGAMI